MSEQIKQLVSINSLQDIFSEYQETPIGLLLEYHNLKRDHDAFEQAQLLLGTCMDSRLRINLPQNFAYIIRTGGSNMRPVEFQVSYAIAVAGVKHMALMVHSQCAMVNLDARKDLFVEGLSNNGGWEAEKAKIHFTKAKPGFEIRNEIEWALTETKRLRELYPGVQIAPLLYKVEDHKIYQIREVEKSSNDSD